MDNFLVRLLVVPLLLGGRQLLNYLLQIMTEDVQPPSSSPVAVDPVSKSAACPNIVSIPSGARRRLDDVLTILLTGTP
jgi:hypothetical protein